MRATQVSPFPRAPKSSCRAVRSTVGTVAPFLKNQYLSSPPGIELLSLKYVASWVGIQEMKVTKRMPTRMDARTPFMSRATMSMPPANPSQSVADCSSPPMHTTFEERGPKASSPIQKPSSFCLQILSNVMSSGFMENMTPRSLGPQPPKVTKVAPSYVTKPMPLLCCRPMNAKKQPMPAAVEYMMFIGMSSIMRDLMPVMARPKKMQPSMNTAAKACL
mmetsp:Transcript_24258/g.66371  ORF Transcript_24258/g.66371 Transcript_24258/m.66371 type:complete len:219 (-) Transcript_24258:611-1267(-)